MKAMCLGDANGNGPLSLVPDELPEPSPGPGELLIRVCAAGVITTELSWYPTTHRADGQLRRRAVPGHEFSGVVADKGEEAGDFAISQTVFGMNDWYADGAMAEFCLAPASWLAAKPGSLSHVEAASVPISALTAWQGLFEHAKLQPGETVLVQGGAGGVGVFTIQLAHLHGARVIATASSGHHEFVSSLGAGQVVDYDQVRFEEAIEPVDVVLDTVGGETLDRSWAMLKPGGRLVTIVSSATGSNDPRVKKAFFIVEPSRTQLTRIAQLLDAGKLKPVIDSVFSLSQAPDVFADKLPRRRRGKVVIAVQDAS
ncbi:MAG TPA: NADP-dependent oxidoreductase [Bryobacteraceae bacterium]|nr:NADP-dependent oxidoreductase [Bryobacteraceae bacterium]